jgi:hypothetical protein
MTREEIEKRMDELARKNTIHRLGNGATVYRS